MNRLRILSLLITALLLFSALASCGGPQINDGQEKSATAQDSPGESIAYDCSSLSVEEEYAKMLPVSTDLKNGDYAKYSGKSVRLKGEYLNSGYSFLVIFLDATRCCYADFELQYAGEYPKAGSQIEVTGKFGSYTASDGTWPCIMVDRLTVLAPPAGA